MYAGSLLSVFATTVLPVLCMVGIGYVLGRVKGLDPGPLNTVVLYVLLPALIFHSLVTTAISGRTALELFTAILVFSLGMLAIAELAGRSLGRSEPELGAIVLAGTFPNVGNFGIPVAEFAFGQTGRSTAALFVVGQNVLLYTVGIYVAARSSAGPWVGSIRRIFELPMLYVVVLGLGVNALGVAPPSDGPAMQTLKLLGDASIPLFLFVLGIELSNAETGRTITSAVPALGLKILVAPLVGVLVALAVGFDNPTVGRAFVLGTAGPVAVTPLVLLVEYSGGTTIDGVTAPEYLGTVIFVTLLASIPLVTVLVTLLRAGAIV